MKYWLFLVMLIISRMTNAETISAVSSQKIKYLTSAYGQTIGPSENASDICAGVASVMTNSTIWNFTVSSIDISLRRCYLSGIYRNGTAIYNTTVDFSYVKSTEYSCLTGYFLSDSSGNADSTAHYCTNTCKTPYTTREGAQCVTYCAPGKTLVNGDCVGAYNTKPSLQLTCEHLSPLFPQLGGDPVVIADGSLFEPESPDYTAAGHFSLQFSRTYHGHNSPHVPANVTNNLIVYKNYLTNSGWTRYVQPAGYTGLPKTSVMYVDSTPRLLSGGVVTEVAKVPGYGYQLWRHNFN